MSKIKQNPIRGTLQKKGFQNGEEGCYIYYTVIFLLFFMYNLHQYKNYIGSPSIKDATYIQRYTKTYKDVNFSLRINFVGKKKQVFTNAHTAISEN